MPLNAEDKAWILQAIRDNTPAPSPSPGDIAKAVGAFLVRTESGEQTGVSLRAAIRETFEKVTGR